MFISCSLVGWLPQSPGWLMWRELEGWARQGDEARPRGKVEVDNKGREAGPQEMLKKKEAMGGSPDRQRKYQAS